MHCSCFAFCLLFFCGRHTYYLPLVWAKGGEGMVERGVRFKYNTRLFARRAASYLLRGLVVHFFRISGAGTRILPAIEVYLLRPLLFRARERQGGSGGRGCLYFGEESLVAVSLRSPITPSPAAVRACVPKTVEYGCSSRLEQGGLDQGCACRSLVAHTPKSCQ